MSSLFRSQDMELVTLSLGRDVAPEAVTALAEKEDLVHVVDLNRDAIKTTSDIKKLKETVANIKMWERKLVNYEDLINTYRAKELPPRGAGEGVNLDVIVDGEPVSRPLPDMVAWFQAYDQEVRKCLGYMPVGEKIVDECVEHLEILRLAQGRAELSNLRQKAQAGVKPGPITDLELGAGEVTGTRELWGTLPSQYQTSFQRFIFRLSRGNFFAQFTPCQELLADPETGAKVSKVRFYALFPGTTIARKVVKLRQTFHASLYKVPRGDALGDLVVEREVSRDDNMMMLSAAKEKVKDLLSKMSWDENYKYSPLRSWQEVLLRERIVDNTLRKCLFVAPGQGGEAKTLVMRGWVPKARMEELNITLNNVPYGRGQISINTVSDWGKNTPPSMFLTNKFTYCFQQVVETYGVPRYKEVNPGLFTIITFPFLFGVMFGDVGHGSIMILVALYYVLNEKMNARKAKEGTLGEFDAWLHGGRYLIMLMGAFGTYCGTIYNDMFSIGLRMFPTTYTFGSIGGIQDGDSVWSEKVYPYGVDPAWVGSVNELKFMNSLKMKLSVIIGVSQMTFGIFLGCLNHLQFRDWISLVFEWIPQMTFMLCTFFYMISIIVYKWSVDWVGEGLPAPNLIQTMIKMFLAPGYVAKDVQLYENQAFYQSWMALAAALSVPTMLLAKPLVHWCLHKEHKPTDDGGNFEMDIAAGEDSRLGGQGGGYGSLNNREEVNVHLDDSKEEEPFDLGEEFIHQGIHTIEFVLGCVSNTASYLRLWALSLAHAELSAVFWDKLIMQYGVMTGNPCVVVIGVAAWVFATIAVLLCMDPLECFLHALRLHWVEFQNKFYNADGICFRPVKFAEEKEN